METADNSEKNLLKRLIPSIVFFVAAALSLLVLNHVPPGWVVAVLTALFIAALRPWLSRD
jgi:uncharacterized membrane protein YccC